MLMMNEEEMPKTRAGRLKQMRKRLFETAAEAAAAWGIERTTYYGLENEMASGRTISAERAIELAQKSRIVSPEWILFGTGQGFSTEHVDKNSRRLSLWLASDISALIQIADGTYPISGKMVTIDAGEEPMAERLFLLRVPDRAMARRESPSYEEGMRVFVDPDRGDNIEEYQPEEVVNVVIAERSRVGANGKLQIVPAFSAIRELTRARNANGGVSVILKSYNAKFEDIEFDPSQGDRLIGVVVGALWLQPRNR